MIKSQIMLVIYALAGMGLRKAKVITLESRKAFVRLLMDCAVPMMILDAFNRSYTSEEIRSSLVIVALSACFSLLSGLLGYVLFRKEEERRRDVLQYAIMYTNSGMIGLPIVSLVFGEKGVFFASMYILPLQVLQWTLGVSLFTRSQKEEEAKKNSFVKNVLFNPVIIVIYIGLFMMLTKITLPETLGKAVKGMGAMATPVSLMLLGAAIMSMKKEMFADKKVLLLTFCRLLLIPSFAVLCLFKTGIDPLLISVCVTLLSMPIANNTATISERYGGDYVFASACVCIATALSVFTVPLISFLLQSLVRL